MRVIVMGVLVVALASGATAADWYVSPSGSDSAAGTATQPLRTIGRALAVANDGDNVLLMAGDYTFPSPPAKNRTTDYVTIRPAPGAEWQARITGYTRPYSNVNYLRFENLITGGLHFDNVTGFQVRGCDVTGSPTLYGIKGTGQDILVEGNVVHGAAKGVVFSGTNVTVRHNEVTASLADGFFMGGGHNVLFEGNYFHGSTPAEGEHPDFFQIYGGNNIVLDGLTLRGNYFDTVGQGFFGERYGGTITNVICENNLICSTHLRAWSIQTTDMVTCRNNTFCFPPEQGLTDPSGGYAVIYMDVWGGGPYVFANNTCRGVGYPSLVQFTHHRNLGFEYAPGGADDIGPVSPLVFFEDFNGRDFRLAATSPGVDAGDAANASAVDVLGRPRDAHPDIGAVEYYASDTKSLQAMFNALLRARRAKIRGEIPHVTGWAVVSDHAGQGAIDTPLGDNAVVADLVGLHQFRVTFDRAMDPATLEAGTVSIVGQHSGDVSGLVASLTLDGDAKVLTVGLSSALDDGDTYTIAVTDVARGDSGGISEGDLDVAVRTLAGDVDGSGGVTAADVTAVRSALGQAAVGGAASLDVDGSGVVDAADMRAVRQRVGRTVP